MRWVTRGHGNVDRVACPWLIKRFIDPEAEFVFVPREEVLRKAKELGAKSLTPRGLTSPMSRHRRGRSAPSSR